MVRSLQCLVSGKVQGVFFRAWARDEAASLGLKGWVRNLTDGTVELLIQGDEEAAAELKKRLLAGSTMARVDDLECKWIEHDTEHTDFHIRN